MDAEIPLAQTAPYQGLSYAVARVIGGRDTPKIFTATYNYTEKRYRLSEK